MVAGRDRAPGPRPARRHHPADGLRFRGAAGAGVPAAGVVDAAPGPAPGRPAVAWHPGQPDGLGRGRPGPGDRRRLGVPARRGRARPGHAGHQRVDDGRHRAVPAVAGAAVRAGARHVRRSLPAARVVHLTGGARRVPGPPARPGGSPADASERGWCRASARSGVFRLHHRGRASDRGAARPRPGRSGRHFRTNLSSESAVRSHRARSPPKASGAAARRTALGHLARLRPGSTAVGDLSLGRDVGTRGAGPGPGSADVRRARASGEPTTPAVVLCRRPLRSLAGPSIGGHSPHPARGPIRRLCVAGLGGIVVGAGQGARRTRRRQRDDHHARPLRHRPLLHIPHERRHGVRHPAPAGAPDGQPPSRRPRRGCDRALDRWPRHRRGCRTRGPGRHPRGQGALPARSGRHADRPLVRPGRCGDAVPARGRRRPGGNRHRAPAARVDPGAPRIPRLDCRAGDRDHDRAAAAERAADGRRHCGRRREPRDRAGHRQPGGRCGGLGTPGPHPISLLEMRARPSGRARRRVQAGSDTGTGPAERRLGHPANEERDARSRPPFGPVPSRRPQPTETEVHRLTDPQVSPYISASTDGAEGAGGRL